MLRVFAACPRYVQGPGALGKLAEIAHGLGRRAAVVVDRHVLEILGSRIRQGFAAPDDQIVPFAGEITRDAVTALTDRVRGHGCDVVVAAGGGKALDAGKAVALRLEVPVVTVPTIASTDAPASRGIALYDDDHRLILVEQLPTNPAAVVVDTTVIAAAPAHFLRAGIGDAVAKKFEAEGCLAGGGLNKHGTRPLLAGLIAADGCYRVLRKHGAGAMRAAGTGIATEDLEAAVEAAFLLSALGFENTGLSLAHSVTRGLVRARQVKDAPHGYHVAYGLLVQFALEGRAQAEIDDLRGFYRSIGLPVDLAALGMDDVAEEDIEAIAQLTMTSPHINNLGREVTLDLLRTALRSIERRRSGP